MDNNLFSIRNEVEYLTRRWPFVILAFLIGSALGWGTGQVLPVEYEANAEMYVAFNADAIFLTPDDYKNWQMGELEAFVLSDSVLDPVLAQLGPGWAGITPAEFRRAISLRWRNAGTWYFVARSDSAEKAIEAAKIWRAVAYEKVSEALKHAVTAYELDLKIKSLTSAQTGSQVRQTEIAALQRSIVDWERSNSEGEISSGARLLLESLARQAARFHPEIPPLPEDGQSAASYRDWISAVLPLLNTEFGSLITQAAALSAEKSAALSDLQTEIQASKALSAFVHIEPLSGEPPEAMPLRSSGLVALLGGFLLSIVWVLYRVGRAALGNKHG